MKVCITDCNYKHPYNRISSVMADAWEIARKAAAFWGGEPKEFFAMSMKLAHKGINADMLDFQDINKEPEINKTFIVVAGLALVGLIAVCAMVLGMLEPTQPILFELVEHQLQPGTNPQIATFDSIGDCVAAMDLTSNDQECRIIR